jgi:threonine/homoserine/homoserine lactone efflux protein
MLSIILFYLAAFLTGFALCIMPGPVAIEVFHNAVKKQNIHALSVGFGAAVGDALWAMIAFFGITPFLANGQANHIEGIFLLVAAVVTLIIGLLAIKDAGLIMKLEQKEEALIQRLEQKQKRKRWSILKGFTMVLVNPLGIGSWIIVLSFLKKLKIYIPLHLSYEIFFILAVMAGAFSYSVAMVLITKRIKSVFEPEKTARIIRVLGYLLIVFSLYFLFYAVRAFFFKKG